MVRSNPTCSEALSKVRVLSGIAASTARPFSPPIAFRTTPRVRPGKLERTQMLEGQCHRCTRWVPVQGVKDADAKVLLLYLLSDGLLNYGACHKGKGTLLVSKAWAVNELSGVVLSISRWKHAATCHGTTTIPGERNVFISDSTN